MRTGKEVGDARRTLENIGCPRGPRLADPCYRTGDGPRRRYQLFRPALPPGRKFVIVLIIIIFFIPVFPRKHGTFWIFE
jgi:hypothetical protein